MQMVTGRFMYGPLDMVTLTGEKVRFSDAVFVPLSVLPALCVNFRLVCARSSLVVLALHIQIDVHIMTQPPSGEWVYFDTELTNSSGRVAYTIPESKRLGIGVYPVKMVVR